MDFYFLVVMLFIFKLKAVTSFLRREGSWGIGDSNLASCPSDHTLGNQGTPRELEVLKASIESGGDQEGHLELVPSDRGVPMPWWAVGRGHTGLPTSPAWHLQMPMYECKTMTWL